MILSTSPTPSGPTPMPIVNPSETPMIDLVADRAKLKTSLYLTAQQVLDLNIEISQLRK